MGGWWFLEIVLCYRSLIRYIRYPIRCQWGKGCNGWEVSIFWKLYFVTDHLSVTSAIQSAANGVTDVADGRLVFSGNCTLLPITYPLHPLSNPLPSFRVL
ncbi:MAG TPA: hypothetical protein DCL61_16605 [Cyanobacteria bacterium UBA12227]|nr:hypothetical protein [Cyanobacteria bacterium UBA12227]